MTKAQNFSALAGTAVLLIAAQLGSGTAHAGNPQTHAEGEVEQGETVYRNYCAACHGPRGEGLSEDWRQPNAQGELPAPPHDESGHTWRHSDEMLYRMIREGWRHPFNKTERLTMPAFGQVLEPEEIRAIVNYLKTLWTDEQRAYQQRQ